MNAKLTRRSLVKSGVCVAVAVPVAGMFAISSATAQAAALDPSDPTAKALGYVKASATPNQKCENCAQFQGKAGDAQGSCTLFPGKTVASGGWCKSWAKKP